MTDPSGSSCIGIKLFLQAHLVLEESESRRTHMQALGCRAILMRRIICSTALSLALLPGCLCSQNAAVISVDASHPGAAISPSMFGIFFEDINFGADGGLYPELVKNRSFEFSEPLTGWHEVLGFSKKGLDPPKGELSVRTENPLNPSNPHYLKVRAYETGYGFWNSGFRGIGVESGAEYRFSAYVRSGGPKAIRFTLTDGSGHEVGSGKLVGS